MRLSGRAAALAVALAAAGCHGRAAALMPADAFATAAPPMRPEEPTQVHFTFTGPTSVTFDWLGSDASVRFWSRESPPREVRAREPVPAPLSTGGPWREAELTGLVPGMEYGYVVGQPKEPIPVSFRVPPAAGTSGFTFVAMGDIGASSDWPEARTTHRLVSLVEPHFVLMLGDLTYADIRAQSSADRHFDDVMAWSRRAAYMPAWGNHEWEEGARDDLRNYKGRFALPHAHAAPGAPADGCCGEDWSWFDYGNVRFIAYPEPYTDATWDDWAARAAPLFEEAQASPALEFVVTYGHRPAYSSGRHGGKDKLRRILDELGRRFSKYVLALAAHGHVYERTRPQAHVVHITAGIGGGPLERAATPCHWESCTPPATTAFRAIHHGFVKVSARAGELRVEAVCGAASPGTDDLRCAEGEIMDRTTITAVAAAGSGASVTPARGAARAGSSGKPRGP